MRKTDNNDATTAAFSPYHKIINNILLFHRYRDIARVTATEL
ncbi:MAG: hypothetical protein AB8Z26_00400 [Coxiella-like endosymbiont]